MAKAKAKIRKKAGTKKAKRAVKSAKPAKKAKSAKKANSAKRAKPGKASKPAKASKASERRAAKRHLVENLWVTEFSDDYQFLVQADDISEGGIFLKRRLKTDRNSSLLRINMGKLGSLRIRAIPVHDRLNDDSYGTGYQFTNLNQNELKTLKGFLRNLD